MGTEEKLLKKFIIEKCKECWNIHLSKDQKECVYLSSYKCKLTDLINKRIINLDDNKCKWFTDKEKGEREYRGSKSRLSIDEEQHDKRRSWNRFCQRQTDTSRGFEPNI